MANTQSTRCLHSVTRWLLAESQCIMLGRAMHSVPAQAASMQIFCLSLKTFGQPAQSKCKGITRQGCFVERKEKTTLSSMISEKLTVNPSFPFGPRGGPGPGQVGGGGGGGESMEGMLLTCWQLIHCLDLCHCARI